MTRAQTNHDRVIGRRRQLTLPCFLVSALLANELTAVNRARGGGAMPDVSRPLALPLMSEQTRVLQVSSSLRPLKWDMLAFS